jgi:CHAT domain
MLPTSQSPSQRDHIWQLVEGLDVRDLIVTYDVESDIPLRHRLDLGILQMKEFFRPQPESDFDALASRVGAFWCDIVRCDVEFDLKRGLAALDDSRADAERLMLAVLEGDEWCGEFGAYVSARWNDGAGKLLYRVGSHARGRMRFATACAIAERRKLWWCRPDLRSNLLRAQLEEARQAAEGSRAPRAMAAVGELVGLKEECELVGRQRGIPLDGTIRPGQALDVEFLRGYSSVLHNLSFAFLEQPAESLELSEHAATISSVLGDSYREAQAINHQARLISLHYKELQCDLDNAKELYRKVLNLRWIRGQRIAAQNLARLDGTLAAARELRRLLNSLDAESSSHGGSAGLDIDLRVYTVDAYRKLAASLADADPSPATAELLEDAQGRELAMARSVRQVIALPAYKRAYSGAMRPAYLRHIEREITEQRADRNLSNRLVGEVLSLVEESSGRELLDLMASSALPLLESPKPPTDQDSRLATVTADSGAVRPEEEPTEVSGNHQRAAPTERRGGLRRPSTVAELEADRQALIEREKEFEDRFLEQPLEAAPHDQEVALRAEMFVLNYSGTCIVRYFTFGLDNETHRPAHLGAFVIRHGLTRLIRCCDYRAVSDLVGSLLAVDVPTEGHSQKIWELLIDPVWTEVSRGGLPEHLVIIPADDLFSVPFQIASKTGYRRGSKPLGALVPLSQSVSLTAFITRGRHLLRRQYVSRDDDLSALVVRDEGVSAQELVRAMWPPEHLRIAGIPPATLDGKCQRFEADWTGLAALAEVKPEFFVYAGHGQYSPSYGELGPFLQMRSSTGEIGRLTAYDVALRLRLPRNRLTILGACLAGQGAQTGVGEVAGFLRSFIAAGAGAIAVPLWKVLDSAMVTTAGLLLAQSRTATQSNGVFDVVKVLHDHYRQVARHDWIDRLPVVLYT